MTISIKRVVTGVDDSGQSIAYEDAPLQPVELAIMPGVQMFQVWGTEGPLRSPLSDPKPDNATFFPGPGGTRFGLFRLPPEQDAGSSEPADGAADLDSQVAEAEAKVPGLLGAFEPDAPGMHQTKTVDYVIVVEGDLWVELDNGKEVHLPPGSCVVQNGARHGWRNHGNVPATLAYVILDVQQPA
ncbi:cupin domain-containing protein [Amycolatopsis sp.]|uniref:cupin domain-containing protein n=1 Tax=Amycolatopsis sp. TaxID=37632 RepID=UPI002CDE5817|nr:cupin domain-containing protein [Amycolatopsis sp.]HVV09305.1 cupin domain-containing protein [Amycolatopsis sp.]